MFYRRRKYDHLPGIAPVGFFIFFFNLSLRSLAIRSRLEKQPIEIRRSFDSRRWFTFVRVLYRLAAKDVFLPGRRQRAVSRSIHVQPVSTTQSQEESVRDRLPIDEQKSNAKKIRATGRKRGRRGTGKWTNNESGVESGVKKTLTTFFLSTPGTLFAGNA